MNSLTLKDLSRERRRVPSTVSRALKGHPAISKETQDIALCDFSGTRMAEPTGLPLTVVDREAGEMGEIAARLLLEKSGCPDGLR